MNSKTTWFLIATALALGGYILFFERDSFPHLPSPETRRLILPALDSQNVTEIEIERTNQTIRAERVHHGWRLLAPRYPAQRSRIEALLESLSELTRTGYVEPKEILDQPGGLAPFGLDPAQAAVTVTAGTNQYRLRIGNRAPIPNQLYLQQIGAPGVFITPATVLQHLPRTVDEWRDPSFIEIPPDFDRLEIQNGGRSFELVHDGSGSNFWRLTRPMPTRADEKRIQELIHALRLTQVLEFVTDDPRANLSRYGLQAPTAELIIGKGSNEVAHIQFGHSPTNRPDAVFARRLSHTNIVLVPQELVEGLQVNYTHFRDRALLRFSPNKVARLEIDAQVDFAVTRQTNGAWRLSGPVDWAADPELVQDSLQLLDRLRIGEFVKDAVTEFGEYGFDPPERRYAVFSTPASEEGTNRPLAEVHFSSNLVDNQLDRAFARRPGEASLYAVSYADIQRLPQAPYELRDRQIWNLPSDSVQSVEVVTEGRTNKVVRLEAGNWSGDPVLDAALQETIYQLAHLQAERWIARGEKFLDLYEIPRWAIVLVTGTGSQENEHRLELSRKPSVDGHWYAAAVLSGDSEPTVFEIPISLFKLLWEYLLAPVTTGTAGAQDKTASASETK